MFHRTGIGQGGKGASSHPGQAFSSSQWLTVFSTSKRQRSIPGDTFYLVSSNGMGESLWSRQRTLCVAVYVCVSAVSLSRQYFSLVSVNLMYCLLWLDALYTKGFGLFVHTLCCFNS